MPQKLFFSKPEPESTYPITCRRVVDPDPAFLLNPDELYILSHTSESM
jgi:hypothetical protein